MLFVSGLNKYLKFCSACLSYKGKEHFRRYTEQSGRGKYRSICKICANRRYKSKNCAKTNQVRLCKKYGLNVEDYQNLWNKQKGRCAICRQPEKVVIKGKSILLPIDHDHQTNLVRGLLCTSCNRGLGLFQDSEDLLIAAARYLHKTKSVL